MTMARRFSAILCAAAFLAALQATAAPSAVSVVLATPDGSGAIGTAILAQKGADVRVTVKFAPRMALNAPVAIYRGNCISPGVGTPAYKLKPLAQGLSETTLHRVSLGTLTSHPYTVVVSRTPSLCGDLPKATPMHTPPS
jgi:hypothetical protein